MHVHQNLLLCLRGHVIRRVLHQKLAEQHRLPLQLRRPRVVGHQIDGFIPEYARAARFEYNDRGAGRNFLGQGIHRLRQVLLRLVEHAEVVQRPPAAHVALQNLDGEARIREHLIGRLGNVGLEIIGERVRPQ